MNTPLHEAQSPIDMTHLGSGSWSYRRRKTVRKEMPYESGMTPIGPGTRRIPVRFYLVAVLFILFDIEIIFIIPWAVILRQFVMENYGLFALIEMAVFIVILLVGFVYAWKKGALEWE